MAETVLVVPFWSQSDAVNWDSNYAYLKRVLPRLVELDPKWFWIVLWPERKPGEKWRYKDDGLFSSDRIIRYPWPYDTAMRSSVTAFDPKRFKKIETTFAPTMYWLHQVESGTMMEGGYSGSWNLRAKPAIVAQHHYIIDDSLPYPVMFPRLWLQMGGSFAANKIILNSEHTKRMMERTFSQWMNEEKMGVLKEKTEVIKFGLVEDWMLDMPIREHPKPVIIYNHRFENYKQPQITAEVVKGLRGEFDFDVWATQHVDQRLSYFPVDKIVGDPEQKKYFENIAVPGINTLNSVHETYCISMVDSISLGQLPVVPNAVTFPELVPPNYPYLFDNPRQQTEMLRQILKGWPETYLEWRDRLREHAKKTFRIDSYARKYHKSMSYTGRFWTSCGIKESTEKNLNQFIASLKPGNYRLNDLVKGVHKATGCAHQSMPARRIVRDLGENENFSVHWDGEQLFIRWRNNAL
jgi:glycosyltransferase involved in cell wall biosynthesis